MAKRKLWITFKEFLKKLNCCSSSCYNNTIENINIDHIESIYNALQEIQTQINEINGVKISQI